MKPFLYHIDCVNRRQKKIALLAMINAKSIADVIGHDENYMTKITYGRIVRQVRLSRIAL